MDKNKQSKKDKERERGTYLVTRILPSNRQAKRMSPAAVSTSIPEPLDIVQHLPPQIILDFHFGQRGCEVEHLRVGEFSDFGLWVDVEASQEAGRDIWTDSEEGFKGFLFF